MGHLCSRGDCHVAAARLLAMTHHCVIASEASPGRRSGAWQSHRVLAGRPRRGLLRRLTSARVSGPAATRPKVSFVCGGLWSQKPTIAVWTCRIRVGAGSPSTRRPSKNAAAAHIAAPAAQAAVVAPVPVVARDLLALPKVPQGVELDMPVADTDESVGRTGVVEVSEEVVGLGGVDGRSVPDIDDGEAASASRPPACLAHGNPLPQKFADLLPGLDPPPGKQTPAVNSAGLDLQGTGGPASMGMCTKRASHSSAQRESIAARGRQSFASLPFPLSVLEGGGRLQVPPRAHGNVPRKMRGMVQHSTQAASLADTRE